MKQGISFILITYALKLGVFYFLCDGAIPDLRNPHESWKIYAIMYTPLLGALICQTIFREGYFSWGKIFGRLNRYHFYALLFPLVLALGSAAISVLFPQVEYNPYFTGVVHYNQNLSPQESEFVTNMISQSPWHYVLSMIFTGIIHGFSFSALTAFGEEFGWRGYLLTKWKDKGFIFNSVAIGAVWGLWHAPLIAQGYNYPSNPSLGVLMMVLCCIAMTPMIIFQTVTRKVYWLLPSSTGLLTLWWLLVLFFLSGGDTFTAGLLSLGAVIFNLLVFFFFLFPKRKEISELLKNY